MKSNNLLKLLCWIPTILVMLYFIPFLGVCLIILRYFVYRNEKRFMMPLTLIGVGLIVFIPKIVGEICDLLNIDNIPYVMDIVKSDVYVKLIDYSEFILCVGIVFIIISFICKSLIDKFISFIKSYIIAHEKQNAEIAQKNNMEIKLKQERAKHTSFVSCPNCGADNVLTDKIGTCKYCRGKLENKNYKS